MTDDTAPRLAVATLNALPPRQYMSMLPNELLFFVLRELFYLQLFRCRRVSGQRAYIRAATS